MEEHELKIHEDQNGASVFLPDGSTYTAKKRHTWHDLETYFLNTINILNDFFKKNSNYTRETLEEVINNIMEFEGEDKLGNLISFYLKDLALSQNGKEKIANLFSIIKCIPRRQTGDLNKDIEDQSGLILHVDNKVIYFKDFVVAALGCHYIARTRKEIVTAAKNYKELFKNFIAAGYVITPICPMIYSDKEQRFLLYDQSEEMRLHSGTLEEEKKGIRDPNFTYYGDEPKVR